MSRDSDATVRAATRDFAAQLQTSSAQRVQAVRTPISATAAGDAIERAYAELTGEPLSGRAKSILTAQWAHETGRGASMYNFNFGGLKGAGPSGLTVAQRTREGYGAGERRVVDQFRAYEGIDEGARDYVRLLLVRYGDALGAAKQGDAAGFVRGLKQRGYFTGDPAAYEKSITTLAQALSRETGELEGAARQDEFGYPSSGPAVRATADPLAGARLGELVRLGQTPETEYSIESRRLAALMAPPQPTAIFEMSQSESSTDDPAPMSAWGGGMSEYDGLTAVSASLMADEVARAALDLSQTGTRRRSATDPAGSADPDSRA